MLLPTQSKFLRLIALMWLLFAPAAARAQCALAGNPDTVQTLADRQIVSGEDEVIVQLRQDGPGFVVGYAPRGRDSSPSVPGGKRVPGGRDTISYTNRDVPAQQAQELHIVGAGLAPLRTVVGPSRKPVVLVIVSNGEMARWKLFVAPGTSLAKVVLQGMPAQVEGLPAGAEIVRRAPCPQHTTGRGVRSEALDIEISPMRLRRVLADIRAFTGLVETSFQHGFAPSSMVASSVRETALPALAHFHAEQIAKATDAKILGYIDAVRARLPDSARPAVSLLMDLVTRGRMPAATFNETGDRLPLLWFPPETPEVGAQLKCASNVLLGQGPSRSVRCPGDPRIYVMEGVGRTTIRESFGNSLIVPGRGSSLVEAGTGRDIIVLERGWGVATIGKTCGRGLPRMRGRRPPLGMMHTGFIVLGPGIRPDDLVWLPTWRREFKLWDASGRDLPAPQRKLNVSNWPARIIVNRATRDILILKTTCFNFAFSEEGRLPPPLWPR